MTTQDYLPWKTASTYAKYLRPGHPLGDCINLNGRIAWDMNLQRLVALPFGVKLPNGVTYGKSILDPNSALIKVLKYIWSTPSADATKRSICTAVFGFGRINGRDIRVTGNDVRFVNLSGWRSPWFAGLVKAGILRRDRNHRYRLSSIGAHILTMHYEAGHFDDANSSTTP